ncbi:hypothetical protein ACROYT_G016474 [Oculina patagonica]
MTSRRKQSSPSKKTTPKVMQSKSASKSEHLWSIKVEHGEAFIFKKKERFCHYGKTYPAVEKVSIFTHKGDKASVPAVKIPCG